jgi:hypothetical protein
MAIIGFNPFEILQNKWYIQVRSSTYKETTLLVYKCVLWKFEKVHEKWIKRHIDLSTNSIMDKK